MIVWGAKNTTKQDEIHFFLPFRVEVIIPSIRQIVLHLLLTWEGLDL